MNLIRVGSREVDLSEIALNNKFVLVRSPETLNGDRVAGRYPSLLLALYSRTVHEWQDGLSSYNVTVIPAD